MNKLINRSWISIILCGLVLVAILATMPDMGKLVREKGQAEIEEHYSYSVANNILKELDGVDKGENVMDIIVVYHMDKKLSQKELDSIKDKISNLESSQDKYGIKKILNVFTNEDIKEQVLSEDGTTLLVPISIEKKGRTVDEIRDELSGELKVDGVEYYATGSDLIMEDFVKTVEVGVQKTELITVILIIIILMLIFRSPTAPFVILINVGLTYLISKGIVLQLVDKLNFTISNFTNVFLILVLFGIGTDYSMLLLMRFKEELHNGADKNTAIINTYRTAGKTVLISSLTILIGFSCLMLSQFKIYRSGSAVAVGVAVLMIMLFSFFPAMMKLLGKYIFWSPLKVPGHSESKMWEKISRFSTKQPYLALLFVLVICGLFYFHTGTLSYNSMNEVGKNYSSVKGFDVIADKFGIGKALPVTIAIKNNGTMNNQNTLSEIDDITEAIKSVDGVEQVYSVTQPKGERIEELYIDDQTNELVNGVDDAKDGVDEINNGLEGAINEIQSKDIDTERWINSKKALMT